VLLGGLGVVVAAGAGAAAVHLTVGGGGYLMFCNLWESHYYAVPAIWG
jgi:hypothetical protein